MGNETQIAFDGLEAIDLAAVFRPEFYTARYWNAESERLRHGPAITRPTPVGPEHDVGCSDGLGTSGGSAKVP